MTLIKVPWYVLRVKVGILDHPQMPGIHAHGKAKPRYVKYIIRQGKAKLRTYIRTPFNVSSPPQCWSQAVGVPSTMYIICKSQHTNQVEISFLDRID